MLDARGVRPMVQIHASLDDVGNQKDGIAAVAGYVAYREVWPEFNGRWLMSLQQLGMPYLHTAKKLNEFPLFGGSGITDDDICLILAPFIEAVKASLLGKGAIPICVVTDRAAYEQLTTKDGKYIRPPEENSFEIAMAIASRALRNPLNIGDSIAVQMDESSNVPSLYARYEALKRGNEEFKSLFGAICFCDDKRHFPIQAADMLANVTLKSIRAFRRGAQLPRAMRELTNVDGKPKMVLHYCDLEHLRRLAQIRAQRREKLEIPTTW